MRIMHLSRAAETLRWFLIPVMNGVIDPTEMKNRVIAYMTAHADTQFILAVGASGADVTRMVMRDAVRLLGIGLAAGAVLSLASAQTAKALLFGVTATDPATLVLAAVALGGVAIGASYLPAWRASRLSPTEALREE